MIGIGPWLETPVGELPGTAIGSCWPSRAGSACMAATAMAVCNAAIVCVPTDFHQARLRLPKEL